MDYNADMLHDVKMTARAQTLMEVTEVLHELALQTKSINDLNWIEKAQRAILELIKS